MASSHTLQVTLTRVAGTQPHERIVLNGNDITNSVMGISFEAQAGEATVATLKLAPVALELDLTVDREHLHIASDRYLTAQEPPGGAA